MIENGFSETLAFIHSVGNCASPHNLGDNGELMAQLLQSLKSDGYTLLQDQQTRNLRGLLAETYEGVNIQDVVLVFVCIIFAGLASGLTQVSMF